MFLRRNKFDRKTFIEPNVEDTSSIELNDNEKILTAPQHPAGTSRAGTK